MNFVTVSDLTKSYGIRTLFKDVNFVVNQGDSLALVAKNGSGKSTLLRIIQGLEPADSGEVEVLKDVQIFTLEQGDDFNENETARGIIFGHDNEILQLLNTYQKLLNEGVYDERMTDVMAKIDEAQAWNTESLFEEIFSNLKIDFLDQQIKDLSGGQRKRVSLAKFLIDISLHEGHQLLILDEPTNHLDIQMVEWLEFFINKENRTLLLVTHDRYFMDKIVDELMIFEGEGKISTFYGSYTEYFLDQRLRQQSVVKDKPAEIKPQNSDQNKLSFKEKKELETLEKEMPELEKRLELLENYLNNGSLEYDQIAEISEKYQKLKDQLEECEIRWLELSEKTA